MLLDAPAMRALERPQTAIAGSDTGLLLHWRTAGRATGELAVSGGHERAAVVSGKLCIRSHFSFLNSARRDRAIWRCWLRSGPGGNARAKRSVLRLSSKSSLLLYRCAGMGARPASDILTLAGWAGALPNSLSPAKAKGQGGDRSVLYRTFAIRPPGCGHIDAFSRFV